jgi:glycine cleavage system regulatory protein
VPVDVFEAVATSWETFYYLNGDTAEETTAHVLRLIGNSCEAGLARVGALFALDAIVTVEAGNAFELYTATRGYEAKELTLSLIEASSMVNNAFIY